MLIRILAPHFVGGVWVHSLEGVVTRAAPILNYMPGWTPYEVWAYALRKGWTAHAAT